MCRSQENKKTFKGLFDKYGGAGVRALIDLLENVSALPTRSQDKLYILELPPAVLALSGDTLSFHTKKLHPKRDRAFLVELAGTAPASASLSWLTFYRHRLFINLEEPAVKQPKNQFPQS